MECRMKSRVKAMVEELAREHQRELAAAGTLVELEKLTREPKPLVRRQGGLLAVDTWRDARERPDARASEWLATSRPIPVSASTVL